MGAMSFGGELDEASSLPADRFVTTKSLERTQSSWQRDDQATSASPMPIPRASSSAHFMPDFGGLVACASCSSHVPMDLFLQILRESARVARRSLRILEIRQEPADHPTPLHFPEGRYLKFVLALAE